MKTLNPVTTVRSLSASRLLLLGIAAGLVAIHLTLVWRSEDANLMGTTPLFWGGVAFLVWCKRQELVLNSRIFATLTGILLVVGVLLKSAFPTGGEFLYLSPLLSGLGLALLASGFGGLKQYSRELCALFCMGAPNVLLSRVADISPLTAMFSNAILWYSGFEVQRQGVTLSLPGGSVEVYAGCSGMDGILHLLSLAGLFLAVFPTGWWEKVLVPIAAIALAFCINGVRVALMAWLQATGDKEAFDYWHLGDGSLIFSTVAGLLFGAFCLWLIQREDEVEDDGAVADS